MIVFPRRTVFPHLFLLLVAGAAVPARAQDSPPPPPASPPSTPESRIIQALRDLGFENLSVRSEDGRVTLWYENRVFRQELSGLGVVAWIAASALPPETPLELVPQNRQIPLLHIAAPAGRWVEFFEGGGIDAFRELLEVRSVDEAGARARRPKGMTRENSSAWRSDFAVRPIFSYEIGFFEENFRWAFWASPEWTMSPAKGLFLTLGIDIQVLNEIEPCENGFRTDLIGERCPDEVAPGRATASWAGWLPGNVLGAASAGLFPDSRYGMAGEISRLVLDGALELRLTGDISGSVDFYVDGVEYSSIGPWSTYAEATYRFRGMDVEASVQGGKYLEGYYGGRVSVSRRFGEAEVSFSAARNEVDDAVGARLRVALPLRRMMRPAVVRLATVPDISVSYTEERRSVAESVSFSDDTGRVRERIFPTYVLNNLDIVRRGRRYVEPEP